MTFASQLCTLLESVFSKSYLHSLPNPQGRVNNDSIHYLMYLEYLTDTILQRNLRPCKLSRGDHGDLLLHVRNLRFDIFLITDKRYGFPGDPVASSKAVLRTYQRAVTFQWLLL